MKEFLNLTSDTALLDADGEFYSYDAGKVVAHDFEEFANYRICYGYKDFYVKLFYRITADSYFQIISYRFSNTDFASDARPNPYALGVTYVESQYKYDENKSAAENIESILYHRFSNRLNREGFPVHFICHLVTKAMLQRIQLRIFRQWHKLFPVQQSHPWIEKLQAAELHPQVVQLTNSMWVANCPNNPMHKIQLNLHSMTWRCPACYYKMPLDDFNEFLAQRNEKSYIPKWYENIKYNVSFRNVRFKIHADYHYNLLMGDGAFILADETSFVTKQVNRLPLFIKTNVQTYPFNPEDDARLEGQLVATLVKSFFNNVECFLTIYRVEDATLKFVAHISHYNIETLSKRAARFKSLPEDAQLRNVLDCIKYRTSEYQDIIETSLYN